MDNLKKAIDALIGSQDRQMIYAKGGAVKATGDFTLEGQLIRFGDPSDTDLVGDFFHNETNFGPAKTLPIFFNHGFDGQIKQRQIGLGELKFDKKGAWLTAQLEEAEEFSEMIMELSRKTINGRPALGFSSGALSHLTTGTWIGKSFAWDQWIIGEASPTVSPAEHRNTVTQKSMIVVPASYMQELPSIKEFTKNKIEKAGTDLNLKITIDGAYLADELTRNKTAKKTMTEPEIAAIKAKKEADEATAKATADLLKKLDGTLDSMSEKIDKLEAAAAKRITEENDTRKGGVSGPGEEGGKSAAAVITHGIGHSKFDNYKTADIALMIACMDAHANLKNSDEYQASQNARACLASRLLSDEGTSKNFVHAQRALKSYADKRGMTLKSGELMQSDLSGGGDEWVGVAYSSTIWDEIRLGTQALPLIRTIEFPAGVERMVIGKKTGSVTFYTIAQAADQTANPGDTEHTVKTSRMTTGSVNLDLAKIGAAATLTGELQEDAFLPVVSLLREDIVDEGAEVMDSLVIDGDTETGATTNINDIAGTPGGTEFFLAFNGLRKSALITTSANSVDVGALTSSDFLAVVALMGDAGKNAADITKVHFLIDPSTNRKAMQLAEFKTRDVNAQATIENGRLTNVYGYNTIVSWNMTRGSAVRLSNAAGKVDLDTTNNNAKGTIIAFRPDQFLFGWRRKGVIEATRIPRADATEFTFILRAGLVQRDTEGVAVGYNVTV